MLHTIQVSSVLTAYTTFNSMKRFVIFIIFYFMIFYYENQVSGTALNNQFGNTGPDLESLTSGRAKLLKGQIKDPDTDRNVSELITSKGYPLEEHTVQTDDGYLLTLLRIPDGRNGTMKGGNKKSVLLIHGDLSDSVQWVLNPSNQSLGFILPDKGYDTWLLNNRGCKYSRKHIEYKTNENRFWNFSFHELGVYDVPATIDYILEATGQDGIYIIGHSRGTTQTFAMLAEKPDYNKKVKLFIAMAPATFLGNMTSAVRVLVPVAEQLAVGIRLTTHGEFLPDSPLGKEIQEKLCSMVAPEVCEGLMFAVGGVDKAQLNETRLDVYIAHFPSSSSVKSLVHYAQVVRSNKFKKFNYGAKRNLRYYNQVVPPEYDLSIITSPVCLIWSTNDALVDPRDVARLRRILRDGNSLFCDYRVPYPYNHFDYAIAKNAPKLLYEPILGMLDTV